MTVRSHLRHSYFKWKLIQLEFRFRTISFKNLFVNQTTTLIYDWKTIANNEERSTSAEWQKKRGRWEAFICSLFYFLQWESAAKHGSMSVSPNVFSLEVNCQTGATQLHSMFRGKWLVMNMEMCLLSVACTHIGKFMKDRHTHIQING